MKKEFTIAGYLFSAIFFAIFAFLFIDAFHQYPNLEEEYILKTEGRNVQATIDGFHCGSASIPAYFNYYLHYSYEENERVWTGTIRYQHRIDEALDREYWKSYYKSMIGNKVEITIDPNSTNCCLTKDVESRYNKVYQSEILQFTFGGVGLLATVVLFIVFLVYLKKDKKVDQCSFIEDNKQ